MKTGFYKLGKLNEKELKKFYMDALMLAYDVQIHKLDAYSSHRRQSTTDKTIKQMLDDVSIKYHNVCIDRSIQLNESKYGEVGYCTMSGPIDYFLFLYLTLDNLKILTDKYSLEMV